VFGFPKRGQPEIRVDHVHADGTPIVPVTPAAVAAAELRRIDAELTRLVAVRPRGSATREAIDQWLERRFSVTSGRRAGVPVIPGRS
jgi:hypothetical protein